MAEPLRAVGRRDELTRALRDEQLIVHFQPAVSLRTSTVRGVEALLRWEHPEHGLLPAGAFLPAYEMSPVMADVTRLVLRQACAQVASDAPADWTVSVNITTADAGRTAIVDDVEAALAFSGLDPHRLILEVTETGVLSNPAVSARVLERLRDSGIAVSLDDFGTGYSSLSLLRELPVDELKIDAMFVAEVDTRPLDASIVSNVVRLADAFGAVVVAEGVERPGQAALLTELGCDYAQGYLWSRPAPLAQVVDMRPVGGARPELPAPGLVARVRGLAAEGASPRSIAAALNGEGRRTPEGKRWHPASVTRLLTRLEAPQQS